MFVCIVLYACLSLIQALTFHNPVDDEVVISPTVTKYKGVYYTGSSFSTLEETIPIKASWDLQNWVNKTYAMKLENTGWARSVSSSRLFVLSDDSFRLYFTGVANVTGQTNVGVAYSSNIMGPYTSTDAPLLPNGFGYIQPAALKADDGSYLFWSNGSAIFGQLLTDDGLNLVSDDFTVLFTGGVNWENGSLLGPYPMIRNNTYYLFYNNYNRFNDWLGISVARSGSPLGPYEKLGPRIVQADEEQSAPGIASVAKYMDGETDLIFFESTQPESIIPMPYLYVRALEWLDDGWPV